MRHSLLRWGCNSNATRQGKEKQGLSDDIGDQLVFDAYDLILERQLLLFQPPQRQDIGAAGAANAGLMAAGILALQNPELAARLDAWREALSASIPEEPKDE